MLTWTEDKDGILHARGLPNCILGEVFEHGGQWAWNARRIPVGLYVSDTTGYPTAKAAQCACEAALLRLGILPLPAWREVTCEGEPTGDWRLDIGNHAWANAVRPDEGEGYAWSVYAHSTPACEGYGTNLATAKATAELYLRTAAADALDAEAAKEGDA